MLSGVLRSPRSAGRSGRVRIPLAFSFAGSFAGIAALAVLFLPPREIAGSNSSLLGPDYDQDGLADYQELVLGTLPDEVDSDGDGYHDIEEVARQTDPLDALSVPSSAPLALGMYAYSEGGFVNIHAAVYVEGGDFSGLQFELGVVYRGQKLIVASTTYSKTGLAFCYSAAKNPLDKIVVLEMPVPASLVSRVGRISMFSTVADGGVGSRPPAVDVVNLIDVNGQLMGIEPAPPSVAGGVGFIYRPLAPFTPPGGSVGGEVCWQRLSPVGTSGASIVYEIDDAGCEPFDSYCNAGDCSASVGTTMTLPDPGSLLGG